MRNTSLLLCGVAIAAWSLVNDAQAANNPSRGATNSEIQVATAATLSTNTETAAKSLDAGANPVEIQMIVASTANNPSAKKGLFNLAKTDPKYADALMDRLESDIGFRDMLILELVLDQELIQMLLNNYSSTHPKATATIAAASSQK